MSTTVPRFTVRLFYSYCHTDSSYRDSMERSLSLLRDRRLLQEWHDARILPGTNIRPEIKAHMDRADIHVFLFSPDFINSEECKREWDYAKDLVASGKRIFRIPVILRPCAWLDFLGEDDVLALPHDGKAISSFADQDEAWLQVYEGIKDVVETLRTTLTPKEDIWNDLIRTEFASLEHIPLQDLFVFPRLACGNVLDAAMDPIQGNSSRDIIDSLDQMLSHRQIFVYGEEKSGKSALAKYIWASLVDRSESVLFLDSDHSRRRITPETIERAYYEQFNGDFKVWMDGVDKTLVVDGLSSDSRLPGSLGFAQTIFDRIVLFSSKDMFASHYFDDDRLVDFVFMEIMPLTNVQQESLIRKRLALLNGGSAVSDSLVDREERRVNSVLVSQRLLPRYPFYVLSILQTLEAYMPPNLQITSYGHCYQALILAHLWLSGVRAEDTDINSCFNFLERLAIETYRRRKEPQRADRFDLWEFVTKYRIDFNIRTSTVNHLKERPYNLIDDDGNFRSRFMYFYFLGKFLASGTDAERRAIIEELCGSSHIETNYLVLLFVIHHSADDSIIFNLLVKTMDLVEGARPATLEPEETKRFSDLIAQLPEDILSDKPLQQLRREERERLDALEEGQVHAKGMDEVEESEADAMLDRANNLYKILRNNQIMGQILRNRYGALDRRTIQDIVRTIAESSFQLVGTVLDSEENISDWASFIGQRNDDWDIEQIKKMLTTVSFLWTVFHLEIVAKIISVPEIMEDIETVVARNPTPAFGLVEYFCQLDIAPKIEDKQRRKLRDLLRKHGDDAFIHRILSLRTQSYMNTHRSGEPIERSICHSLGLVYRPRLIGSERKL